jgi:hypothetical protein
MNSEESGREPGHQRHHVLDRRTTLRGAAVAASLVWVAPAVQVVSMTSAHAASAPPPVVRPPERPPERPPVENPPEVGGVEKPPVVPGASPTSSPTRTVPPARGVPARPPVRGVAAGPVSGAAEQLPVTGAQGTWEALGVGTATVAAGAAAIVAAHHLKTRGAGTGPGAEASEALGEESS